MIQFLLVALLVVGFHRGWNVFAQGAIAAMLAFVAGFRIARIVQEPVYGIVAGIIVFVAWCIVWYVTRTTRVKRG